MTDVTACAGHCTGPMSVLTCAPVIPDQSTQTSVSGTIVQFKNQDVVVVVVIEPISFNSEEL